MVHQCSARRAQGETRYRKNNSAGGGNLMRNLHLQPQAGQNRLLPEPSGEFGGLIVDTDCTIFTVLRLLGCGIPL